MKTRWRDLPFSEAVVINPPVSLKRGKTYPHVDMASVVTQTRSVYSMSTREFRGGGSRFEPGDTLMARITPCLENGKIARFEAFNQTDFQPGHGSTEFIVLRGREYVSDSDYVHYLAKSPEVRGFAIGQMTGTSGRQRVPVDCFEHITISVPPISEQRTIARILGALDDKIELNRRMNETLGANVQAIFNDWFVYFGPVRAKIDGTSPYLPSEVWGLFPNELDANGYPQRWQHYALSELASITKGRSYRSVELAESDVALVTLKSFKRGGGYRLDGLKPYRGDFKSEQILHTGDLIVALTDVTQAADVIGVPAILPTTGEFRTLVASLDIAIVRSKVKELKNSFLFNLFKCGHYRSHTLAHCTGTTVLHLDKHSLPTYPVLMPSDDLLAAFNKIAEPIRLRQNTLSSDSTVLERVRDTLIPKLISGEIRVKDAEKIVESVT